MSGRLLRLASVTASLCAVGQDVVDDVLCGADARALEAPEGDDLAPHAGGFDDAPAGRFQGGVDQLGARFGLIHSGTSGDGR